MNRLIAYLLLVSLCVITGCGRGEKPIVVEQPPPATQAPQEESAEIKAERRAESESWERLTHYLEVHKAKDVRYETDAEGRRVLVELWPGARLTSGLQCCPRVYEGWPEGWVKELAGLKTLRKIAFSDAPVADEDLQSLSRFPRLQELILFRNQISDRGFAHIGALPALTRLEIHYMRVRAENLQELTKLQSLTTFWLRGQDIGEREVQAITRWPNLTELCLDSTNLDDAGLKRLSPLKKLTALDLGDTRISDEGLPALTNFENLTSLDLKFTTITGSGLGSLAPLKKLRKLTLRNSRITDDHMHHVARLNNLEELDLRNTSVTEAGLKPLAGAKNLKRLTLNHCSDAMFAALVDAGLVHTLWEAKGNDGPAKTDEEITSLDFSNMHFSDAGMKKLTGFKNLRELSLLNTEVTADGLLSLVNLTNLRVVWAGSNKSGAVTDEDVKRILPHAARSR